MAGSEQGRRADVHGKSTEVVCIRVAIAADAPTIAGLHADSWRRHYRGAYADSYLDEEADEERLVVWSGRLCPEAPDGAVTLVAESAGVLLGFAHVILDADPRYGALVENLHVVAQRHRTGLGTRLLAHAALVATTRRPGSGLYLWVLDQNTAARAFYEAMGGEVVEDRIAGGPGGTPGRLVGRPKVLRISWPDPSTLASRAERE